MRYNNTVYPCRILIRTARALQSITIFVDRASLSSRHNVREYVYYYGPGVVPGFTVVNYRPSRPSRPSQQSATGARIRSGYNIIASATTDARGARPVVPSTIRRTSATRSQRSKIRAASGVTRAHGDRYRTKLFYRTK